MVCSRIPELNEGHPFKEAERVGVQCEFNESSIGFQWQFNKCSIPCSRDTKDFNKISIIKTKLPNCLLHLIDFQKKLNAEC